MTASFVFIITYAWVWSSDETGALVWLSDWACACRDWLLPPMVALPHACLPVRWWIRTTEVIDDRFTVCSLWPLGKPSIFNYQLDWSWWTDLNPRPADYKSAALPTELHQHFIKSSCLSDLFSIPHAGVFVNRFIRNYCILFFRSIESDTCCRTVSSALDKSG